MTRRLFVFGLLALILTAVESAFLGAMGLTEVGLSLALGVLLLVATRATDIEGAAVAALVGYGWDVFSGAPMGLSVGPAVGVFVLARMLSQAVEVKGGLEIAILGFVGAFLHGLACLGLLFISGSMGELLFWPALRGLMSHSLAAAVVVVPVFAFTRWLDRLLGEDRNESEAWLS